jgi:nucleotide-binding universal stress UspA family protein
VTATSPAAPAPPEPEADDIRRVLILIEDREAAQSALSQGLALAGWHRAEVLFVHIEPEESAPARDGSTAAASGQAPPMTDMRLRSHQLLAAARAAARSAGTSSRSLCLPAGQGGADIARIAREQACDLIVVACAPSNAVTRLLTGSIVPGLITAAAVPVLVCRDADRAASKTALRRRRHRRKADAKDPPPASQAPPGDGT